MLVVLTVSLTSAQINNIKMLNLRPMEIELRMEELHCGWHALRLPALSMTLQLRHTPCLNVVLKFDCS